jgi:hypothetical protein
MLREYDEPPAVTSFVTIAARIFAALTPEERMEIMLDYCRACGGQPDCVCWKDE